MARWKSSNILAGIGIGLLALVGDPAVTTSTPFGDASETQSAERAREVLNMASDLSINRMWGVSSRNELEPIFETGEWLNTPPLSARELQGKVVLVNFWTYTCINSLRALPYLKVWAEKYKDRGLVVIGVHSPEFGVEKNVANIQKAASLYGITYPIAVDSDHRIWEAFRNSAWPTFYFIGSDGRVKHVAIGEGDYDRSEHWIQELLSEAGKNKVNDKIDIVQGKGPLAPADISDLASPESYVGYEKADALAFPGVLVQDRPYEYSGHSHLTLDQWSLRGE